MIYKRFTCIHLIAVAILALILGGCGTIGSVQDEPLPEPPEADNETRELSEDFINTLNATRSELDDVFVGQNKIPQYFLRSPAPERDIGDPNSGFRVQIISTRNISVADSVANNFRFWAKRSIIGYFPEAYVTFDQPYYKVQVGNFHFYDQATEFTRLLKQKYPGAWVVRDRIEPEAVPTGQIRLNEN